MVSVPSPISKWIKRQLEKGVPSISVGEVDADTYLQNGDEFDASVDGDDISPNSVDAQAVSAENEFTPPTVATESDLPVASNVPTGTEITVLSDPNGETSVYKVVNE